MANMLKKFASLLFVFALLVSSWGIAHAQSAGTRYFHETGHNVTGEFLTFYESNPNASFLYGYPITEQITSIDGKTVQYFQRARFEYIAENTEGQRIQLTPLGKSTYVSSSDTYNFNNPFSCRTYTETGFSICLDFLEFFDTYGGVEQFGFPISGFVYHENKLVQYFEKARFEWQDLNPEGQRVKVSDLGYAYFDLLNEDPALQSYAGPLNNAPRIITSLFVRTFVLKAVTLANDNQTFFVIVQDQNGQPVSNATCTVVVHWNNEQSDSTVVTTNEMGLSIFSIEFSNQPQAAFISTDISCTYDSFSAITTTSFRIWY